MQETFNNSGTFYWRGAHDAAFIVLVLAYQFLVQGP